MSETNSRTIESYNSRAQEYINGSPQETSGYVKSWLDETFIAEDIEELLTAAGFKNVDIKYDIESRNTGWLQIIANKIES